MLPALFVSHGAPTFPLRGAPARTLLKQLAGELAGRPRAILVVSAHSETDRPSVTVSAVNETTHDFFGVPEAFHRIRYPAPGSPWLADRVAALLGAGLERDAQRGLDYGA